MNNNESKSELTAEEFLNTKYGDKVKYLNDVLSVKNVIEDMEEYHNSKTSGVRDIEKLKEKFRNDWRDDTEFDEKSWLHVFNWFLPHLQSKGEDVIEISVLKKEIWLLNERELAAQDKKLELVQTLKNQEAAFQVIRQELKKIISAQKEEIAKLKSLSHPQLPDTTKEAQSELFEDFLKEWAEASMDDYAGKDVKGYLMNHFIILKKNNS